MTITDEIMKVTTDVSASDVAVPAVSNTTIGQSAIWRVE